MRWKEGEVANEEKESRLANGKVEELRSNRGEERVGEYCTQKQFAAHELHGMLGAIDGVRTAPLERMQGEVDEGEQVRKRT